ncbi:MAG: Radical SAM domain protein [Microgenomates group bacterium GW2011_GWC1_46_16]|nr:MAG: Radical SAM domain protein [Microgenomates group bacterium GW2011_GWC1_46_16]
MRVLLVPPTFRYAREYPAFLSFSDFPSAFGYLASSLKQAGHEVYGCNPNNIVGYANAYSMLQSVLSQKIGVLKPDLIGLGGLCIDYRFLKDAIGIIRQIDAKVPIVLGGQIVTNDAEFIFNDLKPDYVIVGEGEQAMVELATRPHENGTLAIRTIIGKGLPIDSLPFPDYSPFGIDEMLDEYSMATRVLYRYSRPDPRPFNIVASRGCPYACTFCIDHHRSYRARSIENIMEEIKVSYERYKFNILILLDELFAVSRNRLNDFSQAVLQGKEQHGWDFDWCFQTHARARFDLESLKLARQAGCYMFSYGLESASPTVLKSMDKKIEIEQVTEVIKMVEEAGIAFSANLIFGDVAETQDTISESLSFWFKYGQRCCIFLAEVKPYPGSALFNECLKRGLIADKKQYYETIDTVPINMTAMDDRTYAAMMSLLAQLEQGWLFPQKAMDVHYEVESNHRGKYQTYVGGDYYTVMAKCPYCGEVSPYRQLMPGVPFMLGLSCLKCQRKIKVEVS